MKSECCHRGIMEKEQSLTSLLKQCKSVLLSCKQINQLYFCRKGCVVSLDLTTSNHSNLNLKDCNFKSNRISKSFQCASYGWPSYSCFPISPMLQKSSYVTHKPLHAVLQETLCFSTLISLPLTNDKLYRSIYKSVFICSQDISEKSMHKSSYSGYSILCEESCTLLIV